VRDHGAGVEVLAELDGEPVLLRQGRFLVATFHPELTEDTRVHELFLDQVGEAAKPPVRASGPVVGPGEPGGSPGGDTSG
jgi:hypothetical protein